MTQEIVDAVKVLEQEKGISADTLMDALEDALLSAYRKSPGSAKYARVDLDHETALALELQLLELRLGRELAVHLRLRLLVALRFRECGLAFAPAQPAHHLRDHVVPVVQARTPGERPLPHRLATHRDEARECGRVELLRARAHRVRGGWTLSRHRAPGVRASVSHSDS